MKKYAAIWCLLMLCVLQGYGHTINYQLDKEPTGSVFLKYLVLGYEHIIPLGFDHILFILCVFFLNTNIRQIVLQASMFTIAHSITLGLAMYGIIKPPTNIVEPLIAASIVFLALENIFSKKVSPWRLFTVFMFGMVHGMGFAGALSQLGMPEYAFATSLVAFNVGVEFGQLSIIMVMYFLVSKPFGKFPWYRKRIVIPASVIIAIVASYWTIERIFFLKA